MQAVLIAAALWPSTMAAKDFIYIIGSDVEGKYNNYPPATEEYADEFAGRELYETADGSNVYEGTATFSGDAYFRFVTKLAPAGQDGWRLNCIFPDRDFTNNEEPWMDQLGNSSAWRTDKVHTDAFVPYDPGCWRLPSGTYKITLDLNDRRVYAVSTTSPLLLINDDTTPTLATAANYTSVANTKTYVDGGTFEIRLYDLASGTWLIPNEGYEEIPANGQPLSLTGKWSDETGKPFTSTNWKGGVVKGSNSYNWQYITLTPDIFQFNAEPHSTQHLYMAGSFNNWDTYYDLVELEKLNDAGTLFKGSIPASANDYAEFKFMGGFNWEMDYGSNGYGHIDSEGRPVVYLDCADQVGSQRNNIYVKSGAAAGFEFEVDLTAMTVTLPKGTDVEFSVVPYDAATTDENVIYVNLRGGNLAPWSGAPASVKDQFAVLTPDGKGSYTGTVTCTPSEFAINFISALGAKGNPNTMICPPAGDRELVLVDGQSYSSATAANSSTGYWTLPALVMRRLGIDSPTAFDLTVTPGATPSIAVHIKALEANAPLYLIGTPGGWSCNDDSFQLYYTDADAWYGEFDIPAGDLSFRFFKSLGSWEQPQIGSHPDDFYELPVTFYNGSYYGTAVDGKGNWNIQDWPGGTLYCMVKEEYGEYNVIFSTSAILQAGNPSSGASLDGMFATSIYDNLTPEYRGFKRISEGVYVGEGIDYGNGIRLFSRILPISHEEAAWEGSYALSNLSGGPLTFDKFGVAEASFTHQNEVTTAGAAPFTFDYTDNIPGIFNVTVDLNAGKVYFEQQHMGPKYICGANTGEELPTMATRDKFSDVVIGYRGGLVDIPAGKFDVSMVNSITNGKLNTTEYEVEFDENGIAFFPTDNDMYGYNDKRMVCRNWKGGKVLISGNVIIDLSKVNTVHAFMGLASDPYATISVLTRHGNEAIFKGKADFGKLDGNQWLNFIVNYTPDNYDQRLTLASGLLYGMGSVVGPDNNIFPDTDMQLAGSVVVGGTSYNLPSLVGEGALDIVLNLDDMTFSATVSPENAGTVYEIVADNESGLDGIIATPSGNQENAVTAVANVTSDSESGYEFNLITPDGDVIIPASSSESEITFGPDGSWTGSFATTGSRSVSRHAARTRAASNGKWHFNLPENASGEIQMLIDNTSRTITVFSQDCNRGYFIVDGSIEPVIENIAELRDAMMTPNGDGLFQGSFTIPASGETSVSFVKNLTSSKSASMLNGIYGISINEHVDMATDGTETVCVALGTTAFGLYQATNWTVSDPAGNAHAVFDEQAGTLSFGTGALGVTDATTGLGGIRITPGDGHATIDADAPATVRFYTLQGMLVRTINVAAGRTKVALAPGLYMSCGTKIIIR